MCINYFSAKLTFKVNYPSIRYALIRDGLTVSSRLYARTRFIRYNYRTKGWKRISGAQIGQDTGQAGRSRDLPDETIIDSAADGERSRLPLRKIAAISRDTSIIALLIGEPFTKRYLLLWTVHTITSTITRSFHDKKTTRLAKTTFTRANVPRGNVEFYDKIHV